MTVLIVDDEPSLLRFMAAILQAAGYEVLLADGGDEALAFCEARASGIDLMISDVAMPRMNGRALADCMNDRHPDVPIVFISGYPESRAIVAGLTARGFKNGYTCIQKPFTAQKLLAVVKTVLATAAKVKSSAA
jgi:two-component system cell cycle sensor histidine kinase/response regulator CckA